jgi:hypothetical protein
MQIKVKIEATWIVSTEKEANTLEDTLRDLIEDSDLDLGFQNCFETTREPLPDEGQEQSA